VTFHTSLSLGGPTTPSGRRGGESYPKSDGRRHGACHPTRRRPSAFASLPIKGRDEASCRFELLPDEAEVEADQKEREMRHRAQAVHFGRYHDIRAEERDRCVGEVEVEQDSHTHEECARQKFADLSPIKLNPRYFSELEKGG